MVHNILLQEGLIQPTHWSNSKVKTDLVAEQRKDSNKFNRDKRGGKMGDKTFDT